MARYDRPSRCSAKKPLAFRWYGYPPCEPDVDDVDAAVDVLMKAVSPRGRVWNPWSGSMVKSEFRFRIIRAAKGELEPVDEVKAVDVKNPPPMYERHRKVGSRRKVARPLVLAPVWAVVATALFAVVVAGIKVAEMLPAAANSTPT